MAEKNKKITAEQLLSHSKRQNNRILMWNGIAFTVRNLLSLEEMVLFVNNVMDACYDETHDTLRPEMLDFVFRINVISSYACVDMPDDIEKQYEIAYSTDIYDTIIKAVNNAQVQAMKDAVVNMINR